MVQVLHKLGRHVDAYEAEKAFYEALNLTTDIELQGKLIAELDQFKQDSGDDARLALN